jgi:hypothetical protein
MAAVGSERSKPPGMESVAETEAKPEGPKVLIPTFQCADAGRFPSDA